MCKKNASISRLYFEEVQLKKSKEIRLMKEGNILAFLDVSFISPIVAWVNRIQVDEMYEGRRYGKMLFNYFVSKYGKMIIAGDSDDEARIFWHKVGAKFYGGYNPYYDGVFYINHLGKKQDEVDFLYVLDKHMLNKGESFKKRGVKYILEVELSCCRKDYIHVTEEEKNLILSNKNYIEELNNDIYAKWLHEEYIPVDDIISVEFSKYKSIF